MRLYGLMITKDDPTVFAAWCHDQLALYDAVVCLDGSEADATATIAARYAERLIYLHERDFDIAHQTDHGLRAVAHRELVRRYGTDHWVMCCHADEFCYHDPRKMAALAEAGGYDLVSWLSPHFYPHPSELPDWPARRHLPITEQFRHYHWSYHGDGWPWAEDRLYRNGPGVAWDGVTHMRVRPQGVGRLAPFHPILRHYKVTSLDLDDYEPDGGVTRYRGHWQGQAHRTGLAFAVRRVEDLFVAAVPPYTRCDRFEGTFPHAWNMGDEFRPETTSADESQAEEAEPTRSRVPHTTATNGLRVVTGGPGTTKSDLPRPYRRACRLAAQGRPTAARPLYERLAAETDDPRIKALVANDLAALAALDGDTAKACTTLRAALELDPHCEPARLNLALLEPGAPAGSPPEVGPAGPQAEDGDARQGHGSSFARSSPPLRPLGADAASSPPSPADRNGEPPIKVALLSLLFNWPSTGGGTVHTAELARFLSRAGYDVRHFYARHLDWGVGRVETPLPYPHEALEFDVAGWDADTIRDRFRQAVAAFDPDCVLITDSWNTKPLLAEAVRGYPYVLRLQALECLCPLNNVRLLFDGDGRFQQCPLHQLAHPDACRRCVAERGHCSGALHRAERALAGFGTPDYTERLRRAFREAEAVLVVNPLAEAMVVPYCRATQVVTAGMDPARFPWPPPAAPRAPGREHIAVLLFAGLVGEPMKGFAVLHEACVRLWSQRQDFELVATADPPGPVDAFTRFAGWQSQEDLPKLLRACDVLVMPTVAQEALGRTAVEAMAAGKPVVASRLGGLPYTVVDGLTGLLAAPGDPADLAEKLAALLDDPARCERLGLAGRRRFEEHYAWDVIIERHYRPLLQRRSSRRTTATPTLALVP
jgi:glycosyltransferase involved in cell wall biosynthesis